MSRKILHVECYNEHQVLVFRDRFEITGDGRSISIGRSLHADIVIHDEYLAAMHADLRIVETGEVAVRDLGTVNGVICGGERTEPGQHVPLRGQPLKMGQSTLIVRSTQDEIAPEKPLPGRQLSPKLHPVWMAGTGGTLLSGLVAYDAWLSAPADYITEAAGAVLVAALIILTWAGVWALLSRVILHVWNIWQHIAIACWASVAMFIFSRVADLSRFAFALPNPQWLKWGFGALLVMLLFYYGMRWSSRIGKTRAATLSIVLPALLFAATFWILQRSSARDVNAIEAYLRIYPPSLRVSDGETLDDFFTAAQSLGEASITARDALPRSDNAAE